ncbi:TPA: hypothetical protein TZW92_001873 [Streptococcus suis]|nr:hypothetical protein [Streptococcus suis]
MLRTLIISRWIINIYLFFNIVISSSAMMYYLLAVYLEYKVRNIQFWSLLVLLTFLTLGYIIKTSSQRMEVRPAYFIISSVLGTLPFLSFFDKERLSSIFNNTVFISILVCSLLLCLVFKHVYKKMIYSIIFQSESEIDLTLPAEDSDIEASKKIMLESVRSCVKTKYKKVVVVSGKQYKKDLNNNVSALFELRLTKKILGFINIKIMELELEYSK